MLPAVITAQQILWLVIIIVVVHAILLAPAIVAIIGALGERIENQRHRPKY